MNIFFRILLAIYAFFLTIISAILMLIPFRNEILDRIYYLALHILESKYLTLIFLLVSFLFFVLSLCFLLSGFKSNKDKKAVSKYTNIGEIKISLNSIENIALNTSRRVNGVRETKATITKSEDNVSITLKAIVLPDVNIPALSEELQVKIKEAVEETSGIKVDSVRIIVESIYSGSLIKARVE